MGIHRILPVLFLSATLAACSGSEPVSEVEKQMSGDENKAAADSDGTKAHCLVMNEGYCQGYKADALAAGADFQKDACTSSMAGTWGEGACPAKDAAGTCTIEGGLSKVYYSAGGAQTYTADSAKKSCEQSEEGSFKPAS